ncbi:MAG: DUF1844 domain-containing protein [Thermodesulfobacteriota bacterium]
MDEEHKGFKVTDRRRIGKEAGEEVKEKSEEKVGKQTSDQSVEDSDETASLPPVNFLTLILSLSTSALLHFGEIPDPITKETKKDLVMAKHTIDTISMLKEKTEGNLEEDEDKLITGVLYDLKMKYLSESA